MGVLKASRVVRATREATWKVVSDVAHYADYAPNLSAVHVMSGSGLGMQRTCSNLKGESWSEECVIWDEGNRYSFRVDTSVYPYPIKAMAGTWELEDVSNGTMITMRFDYQMKYGIVGRLAGVALRPWFLRVCHRLLDNWQAAIETRRVGEVHAP